MSRVAMPLKRRRINIPAPLLARRLGFVLQKPLHEHQKIHYGRKALTGQYVKSYVRKGHLPEGVTVDRIPGEPGEVRFSGRRISKGALNRYMRDNGTEGKLDFAESINARRRA